MKILLVKPHPLLKTIRHLQPIIMLEPLELGYLAAAASAQHDIRVLDLRLEKKSHLVFQKTLRDFTPDILGISGYTHEASEVKRLAKLAKQVSPQSTIVIGGHHATVLPEDYDLPYIDAIVQGEGCAPFAAIVKATENADTLENIPNVLIPGSNISGREKEFPQYPDLATLPFPRRDLWPKDRYRCVWATEQHPKWQTIFPPVALVRTSYGCRLECSFCVVPRLCNRKYLTRPPEHVADEIAEIDVDHIYFCDDETFLEPKHARAVAETIRKRGIKKKYFAWARSTTVNRSPELFEVWKSIGLDTVFLGMEATTDDELKDIAKHATVADNEKAHKTLRNMCIAVQAGFMVNADFNERDFDRLAQYVKKMPPAQITFTVFTPSPKSKAWNDQQYKFVVDPYDLHDCMHPLTQTRITMREFYRRFAQLTNIASTKNPLRSPKFRLRPLDIIKIIFVTSRYSKSLKKAYKDFPKDRW